MFSYRVESLGNRKYVPSLMQRVPQAAQCILHNITMRKSYCRKLKFKITILSIHLHCVDNTPTPDCNQNNDIAINSFP
jgi:hypothetical protein